VWTTNHADLTKPAFVARAAAFALATELAAALDRLAPPMATSRHDFLDPIEAHTWRQIPTRLSHVLIAASHGATPWRGNRLLAFALLPGPSFGIRRHVRHPVQWTHQIDLLFFAGALGMTRAARCAATDFGAGALAE
jgi:hypothetical protein